MVHSLLPPELLEPLPDAGLAKINCPEVIAKVHELFCPFYVRKTVREMVCV
jgi:hypothetical protein